MLFQLYQRARRANPRSPFFVTILSGLVLIGAGTLFNPGLPGQLTPPAAPAESKQTQSQPAAPVETAVAPVAPAIVEQPSVAEHHAMQPSPTPPAVVAAPPVAAPTAVATAPPPAAEATPADSAAPERSRPQPSSRGVQRPGLTEDQLAFLEEATTAAQESQRRTGVPASVTIAQAILESNWGRSQLSRVGKNFFGIKATRQPGPAGIIKLPTQEVIAGETIMVNAAFRAYNSMVESFDDHGLFLSTQPRYAAAMEQADDARAFAHAIAEAGYATDPEYPTKLIKLMDRFDLYHYDLAAS